MVNHVGLWIRVVVSIPLEEVSLRLRFESARDYKNLYCKCRGRVDWLSYGPVEATTRVRIPTSAFSFDFFC